MGSGGSSGQGTVTQGATPQIPAELRPLIKQSAAGITAAQKAQPLSDLFNPMVQNVPDLTPLQQLLIQRQVGFALPGGNAGSALTPNMPTGGSMTDTSGLGSASSPELASLMQLMQTTGGPVGSSPTTQQGMGVLENQFNQTTLPTIQNQLALAGLGNSGAVGRSIGDARSGVAAATTPLLQQEVQNRMQSAQQLQQLGGTLAGRERSDVNAAMGAAGQQYDIAAQQAQAQFNDAQRRAALTEQVNFGPLDILGPSLIGQAGQSVTKQDTRGSGLLGSLIGGGSKVFIAATLLKAAAIAMGLVQCFS